MWYQTSVWFRERPATLDRRTAKLGDKTTDKLARGIIHIDRYISTHPRYRIIYIGPVHMGYPSCSSSVLYVSTREQVTLVLALRENTENLWDPDQ